MVKVPPQPAFDPDPATNAQPASVTVTVNTPDDANVRNTSVQFGATPDLGSSSAVQPCGASAQCTVSIPAHPLELLYTKPVYLDDSNNQIGEGAMSVQIASGGSGAGLPVAANSIVNAASLEARIAPASIVSVLGQNLSACAGQLAPGLPPPESLCDTRVRFNGIPGRLYFVSKTKINALLPSSVSPGEHVTVLVENTGGRSNEIVTGPQTVRAEAPAMFSYSSADGVMRAVVQNPGGGLNGPDKQPLHPGETGIVYANALGLTDPPVSDGQPAAANPLSRTVQPVELSINGAPQAVTFSGLTPNAAGLYQVNFVLSENTPLKGDGLDTIQLRVNGVDSPPLAISIGK